MRTLLVTALLLAGCTSAPEPQAVPSPSPSPSGMHAPMTPLSGRPPGRPAGTRLLVSGDEVFVLDTNSGVRTPVTGLPQGWMWWSQSSAGLHVLYGGPAADPQKGRVYLLDGAAATPLARGGSAFPQHAGTGVYVVRPRSKDTCALVLYSLGGVAASDRDYPCSTVPYRDTSAGLIGAGGLFAPDGRSILSGMSVHDAAGRWAVVTRGEKLFRVELHPGGGKPGSIVELAPPPAPDGQLGWVSLSPDGRTAAVALVEPAWPGPRQSFDLWLLDLESAAWSRAPGMPVPAAVKTIAHRWTATGDLVLAGRFPTTGAVRPAEYSGAVVTVRPGLPYLIVERVDLPDGHTVSVM